MASITRERKEIGVAELTVKGCRCWSGYEWIARDKNERPRVCPLFKSANWDKPRRWGRPDLHRAS